MNDVYFTYDGVRYYDVFVTHVDETDYGVEFEWTEIVRRLYPNRHQRKHMRAMWTIAKKYHLDGGIAV